MHDLATDRRVEAVVILRCEPRDSNGTWDRRDAVKAVVAPVVSIEQIGDRKLPTLDPAVSLRKTSLAHQSVFASSTLWKTLRRQSAGQTRMPGSSGHAMGRALAVRRRAKNELKFCN